MGVELTIEKVLQNRADDLKHYLNTGPFLLFDFKVKTDDVAAAETGTTIWTPSAGKKFVICDMIITCSTAGAITIFDGTDNTTLRVAKLNLQANGGAVINYTKPYKSAAADSLLKITTDTFVGSITVSGFEADA